jgi:hypothetical protein
MAVPTAGQHRGRQRSGLPQTILDAIGGTPLIEIDGIWAKLEGEKYVSEYFLEGRG